MSNNVADSNRWLVRLGFGAGYIILTIWAVISLLPLYWIFTTSFQLAKEVFNVPPSFVPQALREIFPLVLSGQFGAAGDLLREATKESYSYLFMSTEMPRWLLNSAMVSAFATVSILFLDSMAAYSFAKKRYPGRDILFWIMISTMMIPGQVTLVPMFILAGNLGMVNSLWAVILPPLSMVFGVFLLRQFMLTIPSELLDAGRIDGAGEFALYWRVILPLAKPGLATLGILTFMAVWNSFLWPLIVLNSNSMYTLPVGLKTLQDKNLASYALLMSGAAIAAVPMIAVFLAFQRYFVKGLTMGSIKG